MGPAFKYALSFCCVTHLYALFPDELLFQLYEFKFTLKKIIKTNVHNSEPKQFTTVTQKLNQGPAENELHRFRLPFFGPFWSCKKGHKNRPHIKSEINAQIIERRYTQ